MVHRVKSVRLIGKGHASCYKDLLKEWYREERFIDVILTCSLAFGNGKPEGEEGLTCHGSDERDICRPIPANRRLF